ncbi:MAG: hypothetical protein ACI4YB_09480 [Oscillospiraceae bacterium]
MTIHPMTISFDWKKDDISKIDFTECTHLTIWHHRSDTYNFSNLPDAPKLRTLIVNFSNVKNLEGLDKYVHLEKIELCYLRNLLTLDGIQEISQQVKFFSIENAKKITDVTQVTKLKNIIGLGIINYGNINDLDFLYEMYNIESIALGDTMIIDGDLNPLVNHFNIRHAGFKNRRHYTHSNQEVDEIHKSRVYSKY